MNDSVPSGRASKSDELLALAARCEAEEPNDELNRAIWLTCVSGATYRRTTVDHPRGSYVLHEERENYRLVSVPRYTTSLDAAVTLVPRSCPWVLEVFEETEIAATLYNDGNMGQKWSVFAKTPALALCAAALKARAAIRSEDE